MTRRLVVPVLFLCLAPISARAQSTLDRDCTAPEHHQFDFWLGSWTVTDSTGRVLGVNDIARFAGGCGLREHWRGARGGEGMSLNVWQPALRRWTQFWVGTGVVLELTGGLDAEGRMVLQGERHTPDGPVLDRITWAPLPSGDVRQQWDISRDGGASWRASFDGIYRPRGARAGPAADEGCPPAGTATALRDIPVCLEEVSFVSDGVTLAGQWFTPRGRGPFPATVVIRGSGTSVRGNPWTELLAAVLVEAGVGILVPDKRGSGASEGDWRAVHFVDLADDAIAGVGYLASRADVVSDRIGLMGLSQGGQIAPIAAARSHSVAFVINIVGAAVPFLENVRFEMLRTFEEEGLGGRELDAAMRMVDAAVAYLSGSLSWDAYAGELQETRAVLGDAITDEYFLHTPDHWRWDFFRRLADFDPADWWQRVTQPTLVLLGEADRNTPTAESASRLRRIFAETEHPDATVLVFEGLGHDLTDHSAHGPMSEHRLHTDVRHALMSWVRRVVSQ